MALFFVDRVANPRTLCTWEHFDRFEKARVCARSAGPGGEIWCVKSQNGPACANICPSMRILSAIRCWALCWLCLTPGCAWLHSLTQATPTAADADALPESSNDEEAGVNDLRNRLRRFRTALGSKHFADADRELSRAEEGIRVSSEITRSHPDFDDLAAAVRAGRPRLETAIEDDRIARRNAAIDDLIHRGQVAMGRIDIVFGEMAAHTPDAEDLQNVNELVKTVRRPATRG